MTQDGPGGPERNLPRLDPATSDDAEARRRAWDPADADRPRNGSVPAPPPANPSISAPHPPGPLAPPGVYGGSASADADNGEWWRYLADPDTSRRDPLRYASFGRRLGAYLIDLIVVSIVASVSLGVAAIVLAAMASSAQPSAALIAAMFTFAFAIGPLYFIIATGVLGRTFGKAALDIAVVRPDGTMPIGVLRSLGRYLATFLSSILVCLGYLMILWDREKRALHDLVAGTRVVQIAESSVDRVALKPVAVAVPVAVLLALTVGFGGLLASIIPEDAIAEFTADFGNNMDDAFADLEDPAFDSTVTVDAPPAPQTDDDNGQVAVLELAVGDCFNVQSGDVIEMVQPRRCQQPHDAQVYAVEDLSDDAVDDGPTQDDLLDVAEDLCLSVAEDRLRTGRGSGNLTLYSLSPTPDSWAFGDRQVVCNVTAQSGKLRRNWVTPEART